jgi:hypothetical protein
MKKQKSRDRPRSKRSNEPLCVQGNGVGYLHVSQNSRIDSDNSDAILSSFNSMYFFSPSSKNYLSFPRLSSPIYSLYSDLNFFSFFFLPTFRMKVSLTTLKFKQDGGQSYNTAMLQGLPLEIDSMASFVQSFFSACRCK